MNKLHFSFFLSLFLLGGLGVGLSVMQQAQDIRGRASELAVPPKPAQKIATTDSMPSNNVTYSSDKYGYAINLDKNYWTENGIIEGKKDLKTLSFELNPYYGRANITIAAHDKSEYPSSVSNTGTTGKDQLDNLVLYVVSIKKSTLAKRMHIIKTEKIKKAGADVYRLTIDEEIFNGKITYYEYIFGKGTNYYEITAKYLPGVSADIAEGFIDSFVSFNQDTSVKGTADKKVEETLLDESKVTQLTSPSVVNIVTIYCANVHPHPEVTINNYIATANIASLSAQPIQFLKPSYTFCTGGTGSGFILTKEGHIVTNGHVAKFFPNESFLNEVFSPDLAQFRIDYIKQAYLNTSEELMSDDEAKAEASPDTMYMNELMWLSNEMTLSLKDKSLTIEKGSTKYFIKLGNNPLPIDPRSAKSNDLFKDVKETKDIKEAAFIAADYPDNDDIDVLLGKTLEKSGPDVAILKIKNNKNLSFPSLKLADIHKLKEGDNLVLIGYPGIVEGSASTSSLLNFKSSAKPTITKGIVSAIKEDQNGRKLIQTDASVSGGNSGGPALDVHGNIIGLVTYGLSSSYGGGNYNFIRSNTEILDLMKKNKITQVDDPANSAWQQGLSYFWNGYYRKSLKSFQEAKKVYPIHPSVDGYIADAKAAIKDGKDKEGILGEIEDRVPLGVLAALSAFILLIGAGGTVYVLKKRKPGNLPNQKMGNPPQAPPPVSSQFNPASLAYKG